MENNDLQDDSKCPICFEIPQNEIFQCRNGHTVCDDCSKTLKECPQCRVEFETNKIRNRALENILDKMKFDCQFKSKGCNEKIRRKEILSHAENCVFGNQVTTFCQLLGYSCDYLFNPKKFQEAVNHFQRKHSFVICRKNEVRICMEGLLGCNLMTGFWTPVLFDLQTEGQSPWILLSLFDFQRKTLSPVCIQLSGVSNVSEVSTEIKFKISGDKASSTPDIIWSTAMLPIQQTSFSLEHPMLTLPLDTLSSFYIANSVLLVKCSSKSSCSVEDKNEILDTIHTFNIPDINPNVSAKMDNIQMKFQKMSVRPFNTLATIPQIVKPPVGVGFVQYANCQLQLPIANANCRKRTYPVFYRCLECNNYDLCEDCFNTGHHNSHVLALIKTIKQYNDLLRSTFIMSRNWRSFYSPEVTERIGIVAGRKHKLECTICSNNYCDYVCLQCNPLYGYCKNCWTSYSSDHVKTHLFAVADTPSKLDIIIRQHNFLHA